MSGSKFSLDLNAFCNKAKKNIDLVVKKVVMDVGSEIVSRSPVGDASYWKNPPPKGYVGGHFRANWQYGFNVTPSGEIAGVDPGGDATLSAIAGRLGQSATAGMHYIMNNAPYAQRIEDGWSKNQAPQGVVMLTVIRWNNIVEDAVNGVKAGGGDMAAGFEAYPL